jgi:hypothetical protein
MCELHTNILLAKLDYWIYLKSNKQQIKKMNNNGDFINFVHAVSYFRNHNIQIFILISL